MNICVPKYINRLSLTISHKFLQGDILTTILAAKARAPAEIFVNGDKPKNFST